MNSQEKEELLKKITEELLRKMTFDNFELKVESKSDADGENFVVNIETTESNLLIGQYGVTLAALQHILRLLVRRETEEKFRFLADVNRYLQAKTSSLAELAMEAAKQAVRDKKPVVLRPMSAYERRLVHLELAGNENVKTESIGEGEDRKVVVRPVGELEKLENLGENLTSKL
ncbi:MAG TPA: R3H domain-containing nucleic acid-binding protein [Candidatus Bathyarchaeia archaeon]|nr:R3H domain-containing nucleic acid-binding protein [Candidatus Bathyarchaeia archaeon]